MYFIGCTRFSLYIPGSNAWDISKVSEDDYLCRLYSDDRMKARFDIFFNKAVPLYKKMSQNYFYKHIVQYSAIMPQKWKDRLFEEVGKYDFLVLSEASENSISVPIKALLADKPSGTLAYFRVDDDDVLSIDYIDALANYAKSDYEGMIVSFGSGLVATYVNGAFSDFRQCYRRFLALGLAFIGRYDAENKNYWLPKYNGHETVDRFSPTVVDSRDPMFIWTHHEFQDTKIRSARTIDLISSKLRGYSRITSLQNYGVRFPTLQREMELLLENNEEVLFLEKIRLSSDRTKFPAVKHKTAKRFFLDYLIMDESFIQGENKGIIQDRHLVVSFEFDKQQNEVVGLTKSANSNIGWYAYVSFVDGEANGQIEFSLNENVLLRGVTLVKWKAKGVALRVNSLRLVSDSIA